MDIDARVAVRYFVKCRDCKMQGPNDRLLKRAVKKWNDLPRPVRKEDRP